MCSEFVSVLFACPPKTPGTKTVPGVRNYMPGSVLLSHGET
ncbi:uncharacterized protein METZ01_LOCUS465465, partial [marine metagenome]